MSVMTYFTRRVQHGIFLQPGLTTGLADSGNVMTRQAAFYLILPSLTMPLDLNHVQDVYYLLLARIAFDLLMTILSVNTF